MADILLDTQGAPTTPGAGTGVFFFDSTAKIPCAKNENGRVFARDGNGSIAAMGAGFATDTYVTDSDLLIPSFGFQARTRFIWQMSASKTGAGTATPIYVVRIGSGRSTSDTARLTLTGPAQTAVADIGTLNLIVVVRSTGASGVLQGTAWWDHTGTAASTTVQGTGFANNGTGHIEGTAAGFDMTSLAGLYIGLSINGGTSALWTVTQIRAEVDW